MDSRLTITLNIENTTFTAVDESPYANWINNGTFDNNHDHLIVHRLTFIGNDKNTLKDISITSSNNIEDFSNTYTVDEISNGLYYYQKLLIPTESHNTNANETLWYDENDKLVYYYDLDAGSVTTYDIESNFDEIYELVTSNTPMNCFYFGEYSITIYGLIECYVLLAEDRINNFLRNNCKQNCDAPCSDYKLDILLAAILVLNYLISKGEYFEAQRILNNLNTCGSLCSEYITDLKGCGCGES